MKRSERPGHRSGPTIIVGWPVLLSRKCAAPRAFGQSNAPRQEAAFTSGQVRDSSGATVLRATAIIGHETSGLRGTFYTSWIAARATVNGVAVDTRAPGFSLWDADVSQRVAGGKSAFVAVDNLTDNQDPNSGKETVTGAPAPLNRLDVGRTFRTGIRISRAR